MGKSSYKSSNISREIPRISGNPDSHTTPTSLPTRIPWNMRMVCEACGKGVPRAWECLEKSLKYWSLAKNIMRSWITWLMASLSPETFRCLACNKTWHSTCFIVVFCRCGNRIRWANLEFQRFRVLLGDVNKNMNMVWWKKIDKNRQESSGVIFLS